MPKRVSKEEIKKTLNAIYHEDAGKKIDMQVRRIVKPKKRRVLVGMIVFFGLISIVSWLGIIFFSRFSIGSSDKVKMAIVGDKKAVAGKDQDYEIKFKNGEDFPLASSEIGLYLPKSFILKSSEPLLSDKKTLKIGTLGVGEERSIKFTGKFYAPLGGKEVLQASLTYKPSNFNSNFEKVGNLEVEITDSAFDGSLDGPDKLVVGDSATYKLTYKNKSDEALDGVAIDAAFPQEFLVATSTPAIGKNNRWAIGKLEKGSEGEVSISGSFASETKGQKDIILKLGIVDKDGAFLGLIEKKATTDVVGGDLVMTITANGSSDAGYARWGEPINYSITYKNEGKDSLSNVKLRMNIAGVPKEQGQTIVNWATFKDGNGGKIEGETIVWTKNEIAGLAKIKPGDEKSVDFSVNVIQKPASPSYRDYKIDGILMAEIERAGNLAVRRKLQSGAVSTFINSDASFASEARYYDAGNNVVGSGPLPPKVGEKTTVKVYWKINNSMHDLENIEVAGALPDGVAFAAPNADAGTLALDSSLKKVVWTLNLMPASAGIVSAQFDLTVLPAAKDADKVMNLLQGIVFTARDKSTGGTITIPAADETTALFDDQFVTVGGKATQ